MVPDLEKIGLMQPYIVQDPKKISGRPDKSDIRVQIEWSNVIEREIEREKVQMKPPL